MKHIVIRLSDNEVLYSGTYNNAHQFMMKLFKKLNKPYNFNQLYKLTYEKEMELNNV